MGGLSAIYSMDTDLDDSDSEFTTFFLGSVTVTFLFGFINNSVLFLKFKNFLDFNIGLAYSSSEEDLMSLANTP